MAGRIMNGWGFGSARDGEGDGETPEPDYSGPGGTENVKSRLPVVAIETDAFAGEALAITSLPGSKIMEAMISPEPEKIIKMVELFKLALTDPLVAQSVEMLTWGELTEAISQWIDRSGPGEDPNRPGHGRVGLF